MSSFVLAVCICVCVFADFIIYCVEFDIAIKKIPVIQIKRDKAILFRVVTSIIQPKKGGHTFKRKN